MRLKHSLTALGASIDGDDGTLTITAPISGSVVDRHVSIGEAITADKELMTVMNTATVVIEALLPESQTRRVVVGQRMIARIPGSPDGYVEGKVESISTTVDPNKRTVAVRAKAANPNFLLRHEMAVDVSITAGGRKEALLVPASALVDEEGLKVIYVKEGERYERRVVSVGTVTYKAAEILSGVEAGEEVVVAGAYQLANMAKGGGGEGDHDDD
jgi:membrane fusion protein, heavy metal efflux system